jgi:hypothetical protein
MKAGKLRKEIEGKLLEASGIPQPMNISKSFELVVFFPKAKAHITPNEYPAVRRSLLRFIERADGAWPAKHAAHSYRFADLNPFSTAGQVSSADPFNRVYLFLAIEPGRARICKRAEIYD